MTEKKRYYRTYVNLEDNNHKPYYNIRDRKKEGNNVLFMINGKYTSKEIVDRLNEQDIEIKRLKEELFEARKDYIVDTADISDKTYLDEMIEEERKEIYGDVE